MPQHDQINARRQAERRAKRKRQVMRNRIVFLVGCLLLLALIVFAGVKVVKALTKEKDPTSQGSSVSQSVSTSVPDSTSQPDSTADPNSAADPDNNAATNTNQNAGNDWLLTLINNNVALPSDWAIETEVAEASTGKELATVAAAAYKEMKAAAANDGVEILLCSGYRSVEYQQGLFDKQVKKMTDKGYSQEDAYNEAKTVVAVPGYSEHNSGLAADIVTPSYQILDSGFANTDAGKWLAANAANYGFILRYPENKQSITGIIYEPWHFRYVGTENAKAIAASGLCLEEYLDSNV